MSTLATPPPPTDDPAAPHSRRPQPSRWRAPAWWAVASTAVVVFGLLTLRVRGGSSPIQLALIGLTPWLIVPLLLAGALAAALWRVGDRRRWVLAALAVSGGGYLSAVAPVQGLARCLTGASAIPADATITIYSHNVLFNGADPTSIAAAVAAADPDVVVLQEASDSFQSALGADPRLSYLAHRSSAGVGPLGGLLLWSRWPIVDQQRIDFVVSDVIDATIDGPQGRFSVANLHTFAPVRQANVDPWQRQFKRLQQLELDQPRVLAGDFNATRHHRPMRQLLDRGWTNATLSPGCGIGATWPARNEPIPFPLLQLDHQLTTGHFEVQDVRLGDAVGSDHRPIIATYAFDRSFLAD